MSEEIPYLNGLSESVQISNTDETVDASLFDPEGGDIIIPSSSQHHMSDIATDQSQEVIAISDDEDEPETGKLSHFHGSVSFPRSSYPDKKI